MKCFFLKKSPEFSGQLIDNRSHQAAFETTEVVGEGAIANIQISFNGLINIEQGDGCGILSEGKTAGRAPDRSQHVVFHQALEHLGDMVFGQTCDFGDFCRIDAVG